MKPSEVLRRAAKLVERDGRLGCVAIFDVSYTDSADALAWFEVVAPKNFDPDNPWWGNWDSFSQPAHCNARIIGLCLAAAIAESEGQ